MTENNIQNKQNRVAAKTATKAVITALLGLAMVATPTMASARPHHHFNLPRRVMHHGNHSFWGRGGRNFWPGFIGGLVGSILGGNVRY